MKLFSKNYSELARCIYNANDILRKWSAEPELIDALNDVEYLLRDLFWQGVTPGDGIVSTLHNGDFIDDVCVFLEIELRDKDNIMQYLSQSQMREAAEHKGSGNDVSYWLFCSTTAMNYKKHLSKMKEEEHD